MGLIKLTIGTFLSITYFNETPIIPDNTEQNMVIAIVIPVLAPSETLKTDAMNMKKRNLLLLLSMSAFLVGCNDTPIVPDTSDTEIIELDKHKIALLKQSIENQISILNSLNELSTSLKSAESKVIIRIDDFQKHYDEISGKHQAFTVSSLKDIKRGINNGRI